MSRTIRKDKYNHIHNDGKTPYKCKCSYCRNETKKKLKIVIIDKEIKNAEIDHQGCTHCGKHNDEECICDY